MSEGAKRGVSRREFLRGTGGVAAASALAGLAVPAVHAAENNTIRLALVGCGGRGTGAAANALATRSGPIKLVAMADVFAHRLKSSHENLTRIVAAQADAPPESRLIGFKASQVDVPPERRFLGFDAYRKAMDCLGPGDVVILTTPCAFRWVHFSLRHREGPQRFHGEADHGRWARHAEDARPGRGGPSRRTSRWAWA